MTIKAIAVTTVAENILSTNSIEPPPQSKKNKALTINTVIVDTKVDLMTGLKETPNALLTGNKIVG